ncbi:hypothetical protein HDU93_003557 [Gonapodya sp. JEL0774]|nr:hypothetical protein HDU93_003557 [Gonapodya sp. JEL0774]
MALISSSVRNPPAISTRSCEKSALRWSCPIFYANSPTELVTMTTVTQMTRCATLVTASIAFVHNQLMISNKTNTLLSWSGRVIAPGYLLTFVLMFGYTYMDPASTGAQATYAIARTFSWLTQSSEALLLATFGDKLVVGKRGIVEYVNWATTILSILTAFVREVLLCYNAIGPYWIQNFTSTPGTATTGLQGLLAAFLIVQIACHMMRIRITHNSEVSKFISAYVNSRASKVGVLVLVRCLSWFLLLIPVLNAASGLSRAWGDNITIYVGTAMVVIMLERGNSASGKGSNQSGPATSASATARSGTMMMKTNTSSVSPDSHVSAPAPAKV